MDIFVGLNADGTISTRPATAEETAKITALIG